jgi:hypothetical protein
MSRPLKERNGRTDVDFFAKNPKIIWNQINPNPNQSGIPIWNQSIPNQINPNNILI